MGKTYSEKLKDPRWQKKRLQLLESAWFMCESCGDTEQTLHVHHGYYEKNLDPWDYPDRAYLVLCSRCHEKWHMYKANIDHYVCRTTVEHLLDIQTIVLQLIMMGPNVTMMFNDLVSGYHRRQFDKAEWAEEKAEAQKRGEYPKDF